LLFIIKTTTQKKKQTNQEPANQEIITKVKGLQFDYLFSDSEVHPFDQVIWEERDAKIANVKGEVIFDKVTYIYDKNNKQLHRNQTQSKA
jgi:hypothetical protein